MSILSGDVVERRMRRKLAKYGYKLHKKNGGYIVTGGPYPDEPDAWYENLDKLVDAVEDFEYRLAE